MKQVFVLSLILILTGCGTRAEIVQRDPNTGYFLTNVKANVSLSENIDLDNHKSIILIPAKTDPTKLDTPFKQWDNRDAFEYGLMKSINYFDTIIDHDELERIIVKNNLGDQVPTITGRVGLHNAAKAYKPFLLLRWENIHTTDSDKPIQLILSDPITNKDLFITQTHWRDWDGTSDQRNWYPMMNALIDYIDKNSKTYKNK